MTKVGLSPKTIINQDLINDYVGYSTNSPEWFKQIIIDQYVKSTDQGRI